MYIPNTVPSDRCKDGEHIRNRLIGCLRDAELVTDEARCLLEEMTARNNIPTNEPSVSFEGPIWSQYDEEEYLRDQGVPVDDEANLKIRELERPVKEFADKHLNSTPELEEGTAAASSLLALHEALIRADADGVHPKQSDHAWGCLAAACGRIARIEGLSCEDNVGTIVKGILLEASGHPEPTHATKKDVQFDELPAWGSPAPRIEAAEGLIVLARKPTCATHDVCEAIERLSNDPVPAVRFQIASMINVIYRTGSDLMWRIVELMCREESSWGVLQGLLSGTLGRLAGAEPDRVAELTRGVFERVREGPGASKVREFCVEIFGGLYIWRDHPLCRNVVLYIATNPAANPEEANRLLAHLREPLTYGPTDPSDPKQDGVRRRALELLGHILHSARNGLLQIEERNLGVFFNDWSQQDQNSARSFARLIDLLARDVYFASGSYNSKRRNQTDIVQTLNREKIERFYREASPILDELADIGFPSVTHHLIETLEAFIPIDPSGVFLRIGRVVRAGQKGAYQYESVAADLVVKLVERYLAEYRTILREDQDYRQTLIEILDIFVQAGWPSARRLTYHLEDIFR